MCWDCDYTYEDLFYEGDGIVSFWHCPSCGVEIEVKIPTEVEDGTQD